MRMFFTINNSIIEHFVRMTPNVEALAMWWYSVFRPVPPLIKEQKLIFNSVLSVIR